MIPPLWFTVKPGSVYPKLVKLTPLGRVSFIVAEEIGNWPVLQNQIV
jgi:DNA-binding PadR family transcriptional regulator